MKYCHHLSTKSNFLLPSILGTMAHTEEVGEVGLYIRKMLHLLEETCTVPRQSVWDGVLTRAQEIPSQWKNFHVVGLIKDSFMEEVNLEHGL